MHAHISYTADTGETLVNETFGPNNIRRRTSGTAELHEVVISRRQARRSFRWSATASSWSSIAPR